jgi:long-chain acyl-CoA synthetase
MRNIAYFLTRSARDRGRRPAVFYREQQHDYRWLDEQVSRLASALVGRGLQQGDRVGLVMENEPRTLIAMWAILRAGMVMVPMNIKLLPEEHAYMLQDCAARAVFVSRGHVDDLQAIRDQLPADLLFVAADGAAGGQTVDFAALLAEGSARFADAETELDDLAWIFYTSGTTGKPKGAMLSHRNLMTMATVQMVEISPVAPDDRVAYIAPISHGNGLLMFQHMARAAAHVFPDFAGFRAASFFAFVERYKVTTVFMVPTMIQRLLEDEAARRSHNISSLRSVIYGGAPMYVEPLKEAIARFGPIFAQLFGQGEAPMACTWLDRAEHALGDPIVERRLASAGRECHLVQVRVIDDAGNALPPNQPGEIVVRGDLVMRGYWNRPEASAETLRNGWLHTGDVGHFDEDGYLYITDRKRDMVITGGSNVYPREIEEVLYRHEKVAEATVFGVRDPQWGERIVAAVVAKPQSGLTEHDVLEWCARHLARFKKPSEVRFVAELPKSGYGKILKREIKAQLFPSG